MACAAAIVAQQVGGKAARDALFLSGFPVTSLPLMVTGAAIASLLVAVGAARVFSRRGPAGVLPFAFFASAALQAGLSWLHLRAPRAAAVAFYLHMAALGPVLVSGFWLGISERFDPRTAKRWIGRIAGAGTLGGLMGGLLAERVAAWIGTAAVLPVLAVLHALCGWRVRAVLDTPVTAPRPEAAPRAPATHGFADGYVRSIAALVLVGSMAATLVDYGFKREVVGAVGAGPALMQVFAAFYTGCGLLAFALQALAGRASVEGLGLARTVALLPFGLTLGGLAALAAPGLATFTALRAMESVLRSSLYRLGYELLYTPVPAISKRGVKTIVDVGVDRAGEIAAAALLTLVPAFAGPAALPRVAASVLAAGAVGLVLARALHALYVRALERSLLSQAIAVGADEVMDATTRQTLERLAPALGAASADTPNAGALPLPGASDALDTGLFVLTWTGAKPATATARPASVAPRMPAAAVDGVDARWAALRSRQGERVRAALRGRGLDPLLAPHAVRLLGWDAVATDAAEALRPLAPRITGQLVDALVDPDEELAIRRRIPELLASAPSARALDGLVRALEDARFPVRRECARALARLRDASPPLRVAAETAYAAVRRETAVTRELWESREGERSLEHVFTLLSLVLPVQPMELARAALLHGDERLRGTALEYLDVVLPADVRAGLWPFLDASPPPARGRPADELLRELLESAPTPPAAPAGPESPR